MEIKGIEYRFRTNLGDRKEIQSKSKKKWALQSLLGRKVHNNQQQRSTKQKVRDHLEMQTQKEVTQKTTQA